MSNDNHPTIPAMPDLLTACQWLRTYAEVQVRRHPEAEDTPHWRDLLAAIAKAEGTEA